MWVGIWVTFLTNSCAGGPAIPFLRDIKYRESAPSSDQAARFIEPPNGTHKTCYPLVGAEILGAYLIRAQGTFQESPYDGRFPLPL